MGALLSKLVSGQSRVGLLKHVPVVVDWPDHAGAVGAALASTDPVASRSRSGKVGVGKPPRQDRNLPHLGATASAVS